jgi:chemotaxis response regulator CheB
VPRRVLVADDNPYIRKALCRLFEAEADYDLCAEAENGRHAIELALQCQPMQFIVEGRYAANVARGKVTLCGKRVSEQKD